MGSFDSKRLIRRSSKESEDLEGERSEWAGFMKEAISAKNGDKRTTALGHIGRYTSVQLTAPPGNFQQALLNAVHSNYFQLLCATVITTNAITMGIEININIGNALASPTYQSKPPEWSKWLNLG